MSEACFLLKKRNRVRFRATGHILLQRTRNRGDRLDFFQMGWEVTEKYTNFVAVIKELFEAMQNKVREVARSFPTRNLSIL
ncbi:hypothetical protein SAMN05216383_108114 [Prevotella sp. KH2C16]|nr:hypothetical protein SAMN05216383_108114 [Prevotella sp. KH2C16]